jgi:hypothetical protein
MAMKSGKGDALRKEKALLHTFVAGQKYGVGRDAPRRFCLSKKRQGQQIYHMLPQVSENSPVSKKTKPASHAGFVNNLRGT